jgi:hypothetical protein
MKTQRTVGSGAAIGSAVALLLISALLAPSTALAGGRTASDTCKLSPTGVEPGASGQAKITGTVEPGYFGTYWISGAITVTCRGLTPGQEYWIEAEDGSGTGGGGTSAVANERGQLSTVFPVWGRLGFWYVEVGGVLWGGLRTHL